MNRSFWQSLVTQYIITKAKLCHSEAGHQSNEVKKQNKTKM